MTPQTVNAYYKPGLNEIVFPAAILQPPSFNLGADDAVNDGAIGAGIGHEIGHGFDDQGSKYDGDGALKSRWTEGDRKKFDERTKALIEQYNQYEPIKGYKVNGALTIGEKIGDLGGAIREIRRLIVRMPEDNPTWGYTRIRGALINVEHRVARSTIARILKAQGIPPVPEGRPCGTRFCAGDMADTIRAGSPIRTPMRRTEFPIPTSDAHRSVQGNVNVSEATVYTVYTMARSDTQSAVLTIRVPAKLHRHLAREARRRRQTRSEVARAILLERFGDMGVADAAGEARRQSLLVSRRRSEREALRFTAGVADLRGWK